MGIREKVKKLPSECAVYLIKDKENKILYVGKASSLKKRLSSYFYPSPDAKTQALLEKAEDIDYILCHSPQQALLLEAALIKEKKPKYNIALRDNKSYPYAAISQEKFPRVFIFRPKGKTLSLLFGPYPAAGILKSALKLVREIFPYRSCRVMPKSPCLFFHLKLCPAPCAAKISLQDYQLTIKNICRILRGERKILKESLKDEMQRLCEEKNFEEAAKMRDKLLAVDSLYQGKPKAHELVSLKEAFHLPRLPLNIEAIDISSLGKSDAVGSVVVFRKGLPDKSSYRRFLIKQADTQDDYEMIKEVVRRRYARLKQEKKPLPELVIIDGGKGHLLKVQEALKALALSIPVAAIAKKNEEIWLPLSGSPSRIPKHEPCLHLIQRLRDEAHRFAHNYQLLRRKKRMGIST